MMILCQNLIELALFDSTIANLLLLFRWFCPIPKLGWDFRGEIRYIAGR